VSGKHVKVHSLLFEPGQGAPLPPLVYVEDTSANGTLLEAAGGRIRALSSSSRSVLLNDGDVLHLGEKTMCIFKCREANGIAFSLTPLQQQEIKARQALLLLCQL
jgi:hypothetical protein